MGKWWDTADQVTLHKGSSSAEFTQPEMCQAAWVGFFFFHLCSVSICTLSCSVTGSSQRCAVDIPEEVCVCAFLWVEIFPFLLFVDRGRVAGGGEGG